MAALDIQTPQDTHMSIVKEDKTMDNDQFRNFTTDGERFDIVFQTYTKMHTYQCVEYVRQKHKEWLQFNHGEYTIMEVVDMLDTFTDEADPDNRNSSFFRVLAIPDAKTAEDKNCVFFLTWALRFDEDFLQVDFPNSYHAFQTAEGLRKDFPDLDWLHLVGLVHDLGKVMALWGEPQFSTVGDTFVVGAKFAPSIVYCDSTFSKNPDLRDERYNTKYGMYEPNCGLDNLLMSWGHDEYMYRVLLHNKCTIPKEGLYCIRFHSFYPWHTGGDYEHFLAEEDHQMKDWILKFNKNDLYTKSPDLPDVESLKPYYQSLIDKYIPGKLKW